ncbi:MAG: amidohydrolase family protein, partial [Candidatus Latescibacteria bacterium]|nr:amidohydrolase family protein [Candidatus Latescibacterota bacterium]
MGIVLKNGTVIDGMGGKPIRGTTVVVDGGRIETIGPDGEVGLEAGAGGEAIDCSGKFVMPGLIDAHVHLSFCPSPDSETAFRILAEEPDDVRTLRETRNAQECLLGGMTTVRDCGAKGLTTLAVRDAMASGLIPGPRILASGMPLTQTFGHLYACGLEVEGVDALRTAVRQLAKDGVDFLKVMATGGMMDKNPNPLLPIYSQEELNTICEEARRLDKRTAAHVVSAEGICRCVEAGINSIEHGAWRCPDGTVGYDPAVVDRMAAEDVSVVYTISGNRRRWLMENEKGASGREAFPGQFEGWKPYRDMRAAGVRVITSSDAGVPATAFRDLYLSLIAFSIVMEMPPMETIGTATREASEVLGMADEIGTLEPGK